MSMSVSKKKRKSIAFPIPGWMAYFQGESAPSKLPNPGKWMYYWKKEDMDTAAALCKKAIEDGVVDEAKYSTVIKPGKDEGVACFYINGEDMEAHKRVIQFFLDNNMIPKTTNGLVRYHNISFKFDDQTRAGEYGAGFHARITLDQFLDLVTGKWIV